MIETDHFFLSIMTNMKGMIHKWKQIARSRRKEIKKGYPPTFMSKRARHFFFHGAESRRELGASTFKFWNFTKQYDGEAQHYIGQIRS